MEAKSGLSLQISALNLSTRQEVMERGHEYSGRYLQIHATVSGAQGPEFVARPNPPKFPFTRLYQMSRQI
jgi:hypothetical protein